MSEIHPTQQACIEAIDRIARTPDGAALYVLLQRQMMAVLPTTDGGALQTNHGERMFAARLIGLMAKGIFESGGRTGHTGSSIGPGGGEQPVVVPLAEPSQYGRQRFPGNRRIGPDTRVPGYDLPDDAA